MMKMIKEHTKLQKVPQIKALGLLNIIWAGLKMCVEAVMYEKVLGIELNMKKSLEYYQIAADGGNKKGD